MFPLILIYEQQTTRSSVLKGIATMKADVLVQKSELNPVEIGQSLSLSVQQSLQNYFSQLDGQNPANLYSVVLSEIEVPLLRVVILYTNGNQSKAAKILGISRGTLRKKLAIYQINESHPSMRLKKR